MFICASNENIAYHKIMILFCFWHSIDLESYEEFKQYLKKESAVKIEFLRNSQEFWGEETVFDTARPVMTFVYDCRSQ